MLPKRHITFIGGVGRPDEFGGELTKNKCIVRKLRNAGVNVRIVDTWRCHHNVKRALNFFGGFFKAVFFHHHDVFVFSTAFSNVYPFVRLMHFLPWHYDMVHWVIGGNLHNRALFGDYKKYVLEDFRLQIVEAEGMKTALMNGLALKNVIVRPNFKDVGTLPFIDKFDDSKIHFLFISRIIRDKGAADILYVSSELNRLGYTNKFVVDFYGSIEPSFKKEFEAGLALCENLRYCGKINMLNWNNYSVLAKYHYMLFPTYWHGEGCPGVIIDSFIAGVPVLASDWAFVTEYVHDGLTGKIFPTRDNEGLLRVMRNAIEGEIDCVTMSKNCQREAMKYDTNTVVDKNLIDQILS